MLKDVQDDLLKEGDTLKESVTALDIRRAAIALLARRDYSRQELRDRLLRRFSGYTPTSDRSPRANPPHSSEASNSSRGSDSDLSGSTLTSLAELIDQQLAELQSENLQSDERFLESFINGRRAKGHGPYKIRQALHGKGISGALLQRYLDDSDESWLILARKVYQKKYGAIFSRHCGEISVNSDLELEGDLDHSVDSKASLDFKERARRMRFLQQRGFPSWVIETLF